MRRKKRVPTFLKHLYVTRSVNGGCKRFYVYENCCAISSDKTTEIFTVTYYSNSVIRKMRFSYFCTAAKRETYDCKVNKKNTLLQYVSVLHIEPNFIRHRSKVICSEANDKERGASS